MLDVIVDSALDHVFDVIALGFLFGLLVEVHKVGIEKRIFVDLVGEVIFAGAVWVRGWRMGWLG